MKRRSVCWNITSKCNENCKFCYSLKNIEECSFEENLIILERIKELNVKEITWTGGEALLYPYLFELMEIVHKNGIRNKLISNGRLISKSMIDKYEKVLDELTLSLDAVNDDILDDLGRGKGHRR